MGEYGGALRGIPLKEEHFVTITGMKCSNKHRIFDFVNTLFSKYLTLKTKIHSHQGHFYLLDRQQTRKKDFSKCMSMLELRSPSNEASMHCVTTTLPGVNLAVSADNRLEVMFSNCMYTLLLWPNTCIQFIINCI